ncbi:aminopeptidase [Candidatus Roizmanbacteria bacterium]|nr:aminopeptidase [Candidatus Roizmanbacteria bacterium]
MYQPDKTILKKYADVLIKFALWSGKGVQKGEVVSLQVPESAKPILEPLQNAILEAGANYITNYLPEDVSRSFYDKANDDQLIFYPKRYALERVNTCDHFVNIISTNNKYELKGVDSKKIMERNKAGKFYLDAFHAKETAGKMTWTLGLYGTDAMAQDARMSIEDYWEQIIKACFLDYEDPISQWRKIFSEIEETREKLNTLKIEWVHIKGADVDLRVKLGKERLWLGGSGRNVPSFELFISPDWRGTEGHIKLNQPLYRYGNLVTGIELEFKKGLVVNAKATENEKLLKDMIAVENADKIGEFSLTDRRFSRITRFMGETLFDENIGGEYGNTHIALGQAYKDSHPNQAALTEGDWEELGYNESVIHTDVISTSNRTVTATLYDGSEMIIYQDGEFTLDK